MVGRDISTARLPTRGAAPPPEGLASACRWAASLAGQRPWRQLFGSRPASEAALREKLALRAGRRVLEIGRRQGSCGVHKRFRSFSATRGTGSVATFRSSAFHPRTLASTFQRSGPCGRRRRVCENGRRRGSRPASVAALRGGASPRQAKATLQGRVCGNASAHLARHAGQGRRRRLYLGRRRSVRATLSTFRVTVSAAVQRAAPPRARKRTASGGGGPPSEPAPRQAKAALQGRVGETLPLI
jgi:hypothetical protein